MVLTHLKKFQVLDVNVSAITMDDVLAFIDDSIKHRRKAYICVAPVSTVIDCQNDSVYKTIINRADIVTPDGMPIVWIGRSKGYKNIQRVYGPDLMLEVCKMSQEKGYRHYFYGSAPETCHLLEAKLKERFSRLSIVGKFSPPFRELSPAEDAEIIDEINRVNPDVLWVGLGSPKQDLWMAEHQEKLHVPVMLGVGAAFDFLSGTKKQAPCWMQKVGLEWFFRLCCEPRRLWKRYLIGNTQFIYYLIRSTLISTVMKKKV